MLSDKYILKTSDFIQVLPSHWEKQFFFTFKNKQKHFENLNRF